MRRIHLISGIIIALVVGYSFAAAKGFVAQSDDPLHTPAKDSAERKAILNAVHGAYKEGADQPAKFLVNYLKVHNGWAWINVTPLNADGKPVADPAPLLFHNEDGKWVNKDLYEVPMDPNDHVGPLEPSARYIKALQGKYPGVPKDIIPRKNR